ncbi:MAG: hypothetical protein ACFCVH_07630 [Alphaproteobacteria bacterium]
MSERSNFLIRCLSGRPGLIALAVVTGLAWHHTVGAATIAGQEDPVVLPMPGLAVPAVSQSDAEGPDMPRSVLAPSCATHDGSACTRLAEICQRLSGDMQPNGDGTQTCLIVLD